MTPLVGVMEGIAGGGTLAAALTGNPALLLVACLEIEVDFADEPVGTLARPFTFRFHTAVAAPPRWPAVTRRTRRKATRTRSAARGPSLVCAHNTRHRAAAQGFAFTEIGGSELRGSAISQSFSRITTGPGVQTPFGL